MTMWGIYGYFYDAGLAPMSSTWRGESRVEHIRLRQVNRRVRGITFSFTSGLLACTITFNFNLKKQVFVLTKRSVAALTACPARTSMPNGWLLQLRWFYKRKGQFSISHQDSKNRLKFSFHQRRKGKMKNKSVQAESSWAKGRSK